MWASTRGLANLVGRCLILRPAPSPPLSFSFCLFERPSERPVSLPSPVGIENASPSRPLAAPLTTPFLVDLRASSPEARTWKIAFSSAYHSPATTILQRLPFSSAYHSPAPTILQRLPFSSAYHPPATTILQRLPFSSDYHSPAPNILQRLPFSSDCHSPAAAILQRLPFSSAYHSPAPTMRNVVARER
jgi:hypothetical protein